MSKAHVRPLGNGVQHKMPVWPFVKGEWTFGLTSPGNPTWLQPFYTMKSLIPRRITHQSLTPIGTIHNQHLILGCVFCVVCQKDWCILPSHRNPNDLRKQPHTTTLTIQTLNTNPRFSQLIICQLSHIKLVFCFTCWQQTNMSDFYEDWFYVRRGSGVIMVCVQGIGLNEPGLVVTAEFQKHAHTMQKPKRVRACMQSVCVCVCVYVDHK